MTQAIKLVRGDTGPQLKVTLTDETTEEAIDLTDAVVVMHFREVDTTTVLDTLTGELLDAVAGEVVFDWAADTLDVPEGAYEGEIEVTFPSELTQSVFTPISFYVREQFA